MIVETNISNKIKNSAGGLSLKRLQGMSSLTTDLGLCGIFFFLYCEDLLFVMVVHNRIMYTVGVISQGQVQGR